MNGVNCVRIAGTERNRFWGMRVSGIPCPVCGYRSGYSAFFSGKFVNGGKSGTRGEQVNPLWENGVPAVIKIMENV